MNRSKRKAIAQETIRILETGTYACLESSCEVDIKTQIEDSIRNTKTYAPEDFDAIESDVAQSLQSRACATKFEVSNATTFAVAREILKENPNARVLCLNFASAKNPGGGFLTGAQAQEEALTRASALYGCLNPQSKYYGVNRAFKSSFYTDHMIYSPAVPVFRGDDDQLLEDPYCVSILTAPAVNRGAVANNEPDRLDEVPATMLSRIEKLLSIAVLHGYENLVLGAWGCGVFRNDPAEMAAWFHAHLGKGGRFENAFKSVRFGVLDYHRDETTYKPFAKQFG